MIRKLAHVVLPEYETLAQCWAALGFPEDNSGTEYARYVPQGVYRRLAAGASSICSRGTAEKELLLGPVADDGRRFQWESFSGRWSHRHWKVTGLLRQVDDRIAATDVVVAVESSAQVDEWTAFTGEALDNLLSDRLSWVVAQFAARNLIGCDALVGWLPDALTEEEVQAYHDLHTSPVAAWTTPHGRVLLEDDDNGRARLDAPMAARADLIRFHLDFAVPSRELRPVRLEWWADIDPDDLVPELGQEYPLSAGMGRRG